ncbi:hypothetical protein TWF106_001664 [Orbilia oligospora]|nr:hypothetical protein TWF106_001664 [Orbilia oligospora]KAF3235556.1 hypothetical protein TWF192_000694 [Orbilia oligospora]
MACSDANKLTFLPSRKEDVITRDQMILVLHKRAGRSAVKKLLSQKSGQGGQGRKGAGRPTPRGSPVRVPNSDVVDSVTSAEKASARRGLTGMFGLTLEQVVAHRIAAAAAMSEFVNTFVGLAIVDATEPATEPTTTTIATTTITAAAAAAIAAP